VRARKAGGIDQERHHERERHALGDDEVGELVDPIDDEEGREDADPDRERGASSLMM
jgi:hypothetical protein